MRRRLLLALLALTLLAPAVQGAPPPGYQVEFILFSRAAPASDEVWPTTHPPLPLQEAVTLPLARDDAGSNNPELLPRQPFTPLPAAALQLNGLAGHLERSRLYTPLAHGGWFQPGLSREEARAVHIHLPSVQSEAEHAPLLLTEKRSEPAPLLEGTLRLILARYLHLEADLRYHPPGAETAGTTEGSPTEGADRPVFRLVESRRMRSSELHYFDHPHFGMLVEVTTAE